MAIQSVNKAPHSPFKEQNLNSTPPIPGTPASNTNKFLDQTRILNIILVGAIPTALIRGTIDPALASRTIRENARIGQGENITTVTGLSATADIVVRLQNVPKDLRRLNLDGVAFNDSDLKNILTMFPKLTYLSCNNCQIGDEKTLAKRLKKLSHLEVLNLRGNSIGKEGARAIATQLKHVPNLKILDLGSNQIDDLGAECFEEEFGRMSKLEILRLDNNKIVFQGAICLATQIAIRKAPKLQQLDLSNNPVSLDYDLIAQLDMLFKNSGRCNKTKFN